MTTAIAERLGTIDDLAEAVDHAQRQAEDHRIECGTGWVYCCSAVCCWMNLELEFSYDVDPESDPQHAEFRELRLDRVQLADVNGDPIRVFVRRQVPERLWKSLETLLRCALAPLSEQLYAKQHSL